MLLRGIEESREPRGLPCQPCRWFFSPGGCAQKGNEEVHGAAIEFQRDMATLL